MCFGSELKATWTAWVGYSGEWKGVWLNWDSGRSAAGFNPHITAGRVRDRVSNADRRRVTETLLSHEYERPIIHVESISLIRSILHPDGAIYEPIYSVGLGGD